MDYSYLEAKRDLDDRSMNQRVWAAFRDGAEEIRSRQGGALRILEIGAGSGSMVERLGAWGVLASLAEGGELHYEAVEPQEALIPVLRERLAARRELSGWRVFHGDVSQYLEEAGGGAELLIAHAVLDLFSAEEATEIADQLLGDGGLLYASITFDGESFFEPVGNRDLDAAVRRAYHDSMARQGVGASGFARKLLITLPAAGMEIEEVGASDWIILPREGSYYPGEGAFLGSILSMVESSVRGALPEEQLEAWLEERREQLEGGRLVYIAHQLDILARKGSSI
ncbi:MAG: class I SAM-dependent methyltransferase [Alkalispirochaetaceae bacterium]